VKLKNYLKEVGGVKKIIALTSFLFIFLLAVLPASSSQAAESVGVTSITLVTDQGEIAAVKNGTNFTLDLLGVPGEIEVQQFKVTANNAVSLTVVPQNIAALLVQLGVNPENLDVKFVNNEAIVDKAKLVNWLDRIGASEFAQQFPVQQLTVQGLRTGYPLLTAEFQDYFNAPFTAIGTVYDEAGNTGKFSLNILTEGWKQEANKWYYYDVEGNAVSNNWLPWNGVWYFFNPDGSMVENNWVDWNNQWYFMNSTGAMETGWVPWGGIWYYMNPTGVMAESSWIYDNGWYYMDHFGRMTTGWISYNGSWYYMNPSTGKMATGWVLDGGKWYYMYNDGRMATNTRIGSYNIGWNGVWIR
jgi:hypothetical protein